MRVKVVHPSLDCSVLVAGKATRRADVLKHAATKSQKRKLRSAYFNYPKSTEALTYYDIQGVCAHYTHSTPVANLWFSSAQTLLCVMSVCLHNKMVLL